MAAASAGFDATQKANQEWRNAPQAQQAKTYGILKQNLDLAKQQFALSHLQHDGLDEIISNNQSALKDINEANIIGANKLIKAKGLTYKQAQQQGFKITQDSAIMDGKVQTADGHWEPTFTVLSNDSDGRIQLSPETMKVLGKYHVAFNSASTMSPPVLNTRQVVGLIHMANTLTTSQEVLNDISEAIYLNQHPDAKPSDAPKFDFASQVDKNPQFRQLAQGIQDSIANGDPIYQVMQKIAAMPNGAALLDNIAPRTERDSFAQKAANDIMEAQSKAKAAGTIASKAAGPMTKDRALTVANDPTATPEQKAEANAVLKGEVKQAAAVAGAQESARQGAQNLASAASNKALQAPAGFTPNPNASTMTTEQLKADLKSKSVTIPENFDALYAIANHQAKLSTLPSNPRKGSTVMAQQQGLSYIHQYINPNYQESDYDAAAGLNKELASSKQGTAGGVLLNAGTASQHLALLDEAATALDNNDVQALNQIANRLGVAIGKSSTTTFKAIAEQANNEVAKVVAGGSPHEAELSQLRDNLNSDQSPKQTRGVIRAYIGLMQGRINEIDDRSMQYFNRHVHLSPETQKVFAKYSQPATPQGRPVVQNGKVIGYTTDGKTMTPVSPASAQ
jgi:hypothetical protein